MVIRFFPATVPAVSANTVTIGIGAYWDKGCTKAVSSIDWGTMEPGVKIDKTIYLRNEEDSTISLSLATKNWSPVDASDHITLNWNYNGGSVSPKTVLQTILTLLVSPKIKGITSFNFDIIITTVTSESDIPDQSMLFPGKISADHNWAGISFSGFSSTPTIIAQIMTENGGQNCHVDLGKPSASGFQARVEEDASCDGSHARETIGWMAIKPGEYTVDGKKIMAGTVTVDHNWREVTFPQGFGSTPVIVAVITTENGGQNCHVDLGKPSASGFQARVEEDASCDGSHARETIGWIAMDPGTYNIDGVTLVAGKIIADHNWAGVSFSGFSSTPTIIAQIMTENGGQNCHVDLGKPSASGFQARVEEDASCDGAHARETIGWMAIK